MRLPTAAGLLEQLALRYVRARDGQLAVEKLDSRIMWRHVRKIVCHF